MILIFLTYLSTKISLTWVKEEITCGNYTKITGAVFIDVRKAFNTVDHTLLYADSTVKALSKCILGIYCLLLTLLRVTF